MPRIQVFLFTADYHSECYNCGRKPTVVIPEHPVPNTQLCGACFFSDRSMSDPETWNQQQEESE